jgi:hypothetical protein
MNKKQTLLLLTLLLSQFAMSNSEGHQRSWPGKNLSTTLPAGKNFVQKQSNLSPAQIKWVESNLGEKIRTDDRAPIFYSASAPDGTVSAWILFLDSTGKNGKLELGVAFDPHGSVMNVALIDSSESKELETTEFLSQFKGKKLPQKFVVGEDIVSPKGQELTVQAIGTSIRRALLIALASLKLGSIK